ncbi:MAG TPA: hypothetical protein VMF05_13500 [Stellaceae bacterium]|nr:hypothetical protein [Stellaceae bacterium]
MNDAQARSLVLRRIYDVRQCQQYVQLTQLDDLGFDLVALDRYLGQLADQDLIRRKPLRDGTLLIFDMIQITAIGADAIEQPQPGLPQTILNISGTEVHVGPSHTQNIKVGAAGTVQAPNDHCEIPPREKSAFGTVLGLFRQWILGGS